jgi:hypothetical protein
VSHKCRAGDTVSAVSRARQPTTADPGRADARRTKAAEPAKTDDTAAGAPAEPPGDDASRPTLRSRVAAWTSTTGAFDTAACLVYLTFALWVTHGLWPDPNVRAIGENANDQVLIEWFLAHGVLVWRGDFSFVTDRLNSPDGVNLMSNASHIVHGVLMAPVTVLFGAAVSFALLVALNLAATAAGWYLLFARGLGLNRGAALVGAFFTGFAPGMISQSNSHLHMTAQWLVPPMVWCVIKLTRVQTPRSTLITAFGLAALVCTQLLLGEEVLFLTALTLLLFGLIYAAIRWRWTIEMAPRFLAGGVVAAGVSLLAMAYPLWVQLDGPLHTPNAPFAPIYFYADIASYAVISPLSIAGSTEAGKLATSATEMNAYLGLPLLFVLLGLAVWRWRSPVVVAASVAGIVMAILSFGPFPAINGERTGWPSLYNNIADIPLVNGALPTRYSLALIPLIGLVLAICVDAAVRAGGAARVIVPVAIVAALVPTLPKPLTTVERAPVPEFITSGDWRQCAPDGGVLVPVPLPTPTEPDAMRWPAAANDAFGIPEGFFIGPYGPEGRSSIGTYKQPTSALLADVAHTGALPAITDATRALARRDLAFWKADCVALAHGPFEGQLRSTLEALLGPGTPINDTWTWKITR